MARLGYHAMRLAWCRAALLAFLRRWAIYLLVAAALAGAASSGGGAAARALAAWTVLPLLRAVGDVAEGGGATPLVAAILAHAAVAALLVRALRGLLWPARWAAAERALPLEPGETLRSDAVVVAGALTPLALVQSVGAQALLAVDPPWLHGARAFALVVLAVALVASLALAVAVLRVLRRAAPAGGEVALARWRSRRAGPRSVLPAAADRWAVALVLLPLWRGPARRTGRAVAAATAGLALPVLALRLQPAATAWWLAAFALLAPATASRLRVLARDDFAALRAASRCLPIRPGALDRRIGLLPMLPVLVAAPLLLPTALPMAAGRWPVLVAFVAACIAVAAFEATRRAPGEPAASASRFLVTAAVLVALASEATP